MSANTDSPVKTSPKKPYHEPQLVAYGDVREITQGINTSNGAADGTVIRGRIRRTGAVI